jgi:hypothetical protein
VPLALKLTVSDAEGSALKFTATGLPQGLSINAASGLISGTPKTVGANQVTVTVSDGVNNVSRSFSWQINAAPSRSKSASHDELESDSTDGAAAENDFVGVTGDFDGDGRNDLATYRLSSSEWRIWTSSSNFATPMVMTWGDAGDKPMPADYNGDKVTDFAVYRPSTGTWHLSLSGSQTALAIHWGGPDDLPVSLDHDGDGKADLAVIRDGRFEILLSGSNYSKSVQIQ